MKVWRRAELASVIDHTKLGPDVSQKDIEQLCQEAIRYNFHAVCVSPFYVPLAKSLLKDSQVKVATVIGFPQGANATSVKVFEAEQALRDGADELDLVINIAALKGRDYKYVLEEIRVVRQATEKSPRPIILKAILETSLLSEEEKVAGCILAKAAGADFVKTSTGFASGGATVEDVKLLRQTVGPKMGVKASGGIRDHQTAVAMLEAGATRLGTSAGVQILEEVPP